MAVGERQLPAARADHRRPSHRRRYTGENKYDLMATDPHLHAMLSARPGCFRDSRVLCAHARLGPDAGSRHRRLLPTMAGAGHRLAGSKAGR